MRPAAGIVLAAVAAIALVAAAPARADGPGPEQADRPPRSLWQGMLLYLPNRFFDVLDVGRARVRVGAGLAVSMRATELVDGFAGTYQSVFAGLHGPRGRRVVPWPAGRESRRGFELSVMDGTTQRPGDPRYGPGEFGVGLHVIAVGADVGIDPLEALDALAGFFLIDFRGDDL